MILDVSIIILIILLGLNFDLFFKKLNQGDRRILRILYLYHLIFTCLFSYVILNEGGDATVYWFDREEVRFLGFSDVIEIFKLKQATGFLMLLNFFPAKLLGLSFFTGCLIYSLIGYLGFLLFYLVIKENVPSLELLKRKKIFSISIFPVFLFLPNIHFWTSGIGKDTLLFFCVALFTYGIFNIRKRFFYIIISIIISIIVRPHILAFMLLGFGFGYLFSSSLKNYQKFFLILLFMGSFALMFNYLLNFVNLESTDSQSIESFTNRSNENLNSGGSAVDMQSYPYPIKLFTFLYRPLFIDSPNILGLLSSFENLLILFFSLSVFKKGFFREFKVANHIIKGIFFIFLFGALTFPLILSNMGIMLRQKTPFIVCLIIFGYWIISKRLQEKNN